MSLRFTGVNQRLDQIQRLEFLRPITFAKRGAISGAEEISTKTLFAGPIEINSRGDVRGINTLSCKGTITTESGLTLKEFTTQGKIQSGGPMLAAGQGHLSFVGVGASDSNYGKTDSYYTRAYETVLPDTYNPPLYLFSNDPNTYHLKITQTGSRTLDDGVTVEPVLATYTYNFPNGNWTVSELVSYFNEELRVANSSPVFLSYDAEADVFTLTVDDQIGEDVQGAWTTYFSPPWMSEIVVDKASLLLQRLGFISTINARNPQAITDLVSINKTISGTFPTCFLKSIGAAQGYYWGGIKNDPYSEVWSPALNVWVGSDTTQDSRYRVLKTMTAERISAGLSNEQFTVSTLNADNLVTVSASVTAPNFEASESGFTMTSSGVARDNVLSIAEITDRGTIILTGTDDDVSYAEDGVLQGAALGNSVLHLRTRNPKTLDVGPSLAFEATYSTAAIGTSKTVMAPYGALKAVPSSQFTPNSFDSVPGGQLLLMTTPQGLSNPKEALRINENQQVCIGLTSSSESRVTSSYGEKLYVNGASFLNGDTYVGSSLFVSGDLTLSGVTTAASLQVTGNISNEGFETLQTQVNALITVLAENYDQIDLIANPSPTYSGLQVTNVMKVATITPPDESTGSIAMTQATFSSAVVNELSGGSANLYDTLTVGGGIYGTLLTPAQTEVTSLGELTRLSVTNDVTAESAIFTGICSAQAGLDGTLLTPLQPNVTGLGTQTTFSAVDGTITNLFNTTASIDTLTVNKSLSAPIGAIDTIICSEASVLGIHTATTIDATTLSSVTVSASAVTASGVVSSAAGFTGQLLTADQPYVSSLGSLSSLTVDGTATVTDLSVTNTLTANSFVGTMSSPSQPLITSVGTLDSLTVSGIATAGSAIFSGICSAASGFYGSIQTPYQTNITKVGTLESLTVSGDFSFGTTLSVSASNYRVGINSTSPTQTLDVAGSMRVTGVGTVGSLGVSTNLSVTGVTTTASLNVSGVGTTGSLMVTGVGTVGSLGVSTNLSVSGITTTANLNTSGIATSASLRVTGVGTVGSLGVSTNLSVSGVTTTASLSVSGVGTFSSGLQIASLYMTAPVAIIASATQSVTKDTLTSVSWTTQKTSGSGITLSTSTITNSSGAGRWVYVCYSLRWDANSVNSRQAYILTSSTTGNVPNADEVAYSAVSGAGGGGDTAQTGSAIVYLASGGSMGVRVYHDSTTTTLAVAGYLTVMFL
jgi:hypothetical protein